jgi:photosystem II stability/assembly factor-like uncharacterized protein
MRTWLVTAVLALSVQAGSAAAAPEVNRWAPIGPQASTVLAFAYDPFSPGVLFAGTYFGGLYRSADYGFSFTPITSDFSSRSVNAIAFDPAHAGTIYVGTFQGGVYKSSDSGATWAAINSGLTALDVQTIAIDPANPSVVLAGSSSGGVFRSADAGSSWARVDTASPPLQAQAIAFDPLHTGTVYLGTIGSGLFQSTDAGATWTAAGNGLPAGVSVLRLRSSTLDVWYAGTDHGIYRRAAGDAAWRDITGNVPVVPVDDVLPRPGQPRTIVVATVLGTYVLDDDSVAAPSWRLWTALPSRTLAVDPNGYVFHVAAIHGDVQATADFGQHWYSATSGFQNVFVGALAVVDNGVPIVYAGSDTAVHRNASGAWDAPFDQKQGIFDIQADPGDPNTLYIGTEHSGVWKTTDAGATWNTASSDIVPANVNAIAESADGNTLYAATSSGLFISPSHGSVWATGSTGALSIVLSMAADPARFPILWIGGPSGTVLRSNDGGYSFGDASHGLPNEAVVKLFATPWEKTYAVTASGALFATSDNGLNWFRADAGIGQPVTAIASDPTRGWVVYAGTNGGGVFKSESGSLTWTAINNGLPDPFVVSIAVDPHNAPTVYAGAATGLFKSSDGGSSWTKVGQGLPSAPATAIVVDAADSSIVYASLQAHGVFRSIDGGASFVDAGSGLPTSAATPIAVSASRVGDLYAGTVSHGMYRSSDRGATWSSSSFGMTLFVRGLAVDPQTHSRVFAGSLGAGVFRTTDGGGSWQPVGLSDRNIFKLAIDPTTPATVYAATSQGVAVSHDSGTTWRDAGQRAPFVDAMAVDPGDRNHVFIGTAGGAVFASDDAGRSWRSAGAGLPPFTIFALAIDPASSTLYAAPERHGIYRSTNGGGSWSALPGGPVDGSFVTALSVDASGALYLSTSDSGVAVFANGGWRLASSGLATPHIAQVATLSGGVLLAATLDGGIFRSMDAGQSWQWASHGLSTSQINSLTNGGAVVYAATPDGVYASSDGGASWRASNGGIGRVNVTAVVVDPANASLLYAATNGNGVFRSSDAGQTWERASTGLLNLDVRTLGAATAPGSLYAGTLGGGVARTSDGGRTWAGGTMADVGNNFTLALAIDPTAPQTLYAATAGQGVLKSVDGGANWTSINNGLGSLFLLSLTIDKSRPQTLYAGSSDAGVFVTTNGGGTWQPLNDGLSNHVVTSLAVDPDRTWHVFAGTEGGGVFANVVTVPASSCTYAVSPATVAAPSAASTYSLSVATADGCAWRVDSTAEWIGVTSPGGGVGPGTVVIDVPINIGQDARSGVVFVAGVPVTVVQAGLRRLFKLTVRTSGNGSGTVASDWVGISCGTDCTQLYTEALPVILTPTPARGSVFAGWSGDADCADGSLIMSADRACVAQFDATGDFDGDGLPDTFEVRFGLDPASPDDDNGANGDPDGDGVSNLNEFKDGTHPRGFAVSYAPIVDTSEGAATEFAFFNPGTAAAHVLLRVQKPDGSQSSVPVIVGAGQRQTVDAVQLATLPPARYTAVIESDVQIAADATTRFGAPYAAQAMDAVGAAQRWYVPNASTRNDLEATLVLFNPQRSPAGVDITVLAPGVAPVSAHYTLAASQRVEVDVAGLDPSLASADFALAVSADAPIVAAATTSTADGRIHASLGAAATPSSMSFFASGQTDSGMQTFIDLFNPTGTAATAQITYLLPSGGIVQRGHPVGPFAGVRIAAASDDGLLADTSFAAVIVSDGAPLAASSSRWWPGPGVEGWYEATGTPGVPTSGTAWAVASGEVGSPANTITRVDIANVSAAPGSARVRLVFDDGTASSERVYALPALSRTTVDVAADFGAVAWRHFSVLVFSEASGGAAPAQIVVEETTLSSPDGVVWAAGTHVSGVRVQE